MASYTIYTSANRTVVRINATKSFKDCLINSGVPAQDIKEVTIDSPGSEDLTKQVSDLVPTKLKGKWPFVFQNDKFIANDLLALQEWLTESAAKAAKASEPASSGSDSSGASERSAEDQSEAAADAPKKKRGRPPSGKPKPDKPPGPPGKRGRPPSNKPKPVPNPETDQPKRGRGRPPSTTPKPAPPPKVGPPAKRGRPPTKPRDESAPAAPAATKKKAAPKDAPPARPSSSRRAAPARKLTPQELLEQEFKGRNPRGIQHCSDCGVFYLKSHNSCKEITAKRQRRA